MGGRKRMAGYLILALLIPAALYVWSLWYYGGRYRSGSLLAASAVRVDTWIPTLVQDSMAVLPAFLAVVPALILLGHRRFAEEMGLCVGRRRKPVYVAAGACLLILAAALRLAKLEPLAIGYLWVYYLLFTAFTEEVIFRGLLPFLMKKAGAPVWAVWGIPGVLFAWMHTLMPMVQTRFTPGAFLVLLASTLAGYTVAHCAFYWLRCWAGTLWLSVLVHGLLDFSVVFFR